MKILMVYDTQPKFHSNESSTDSITALELQQPLSAACSAHNRCDLSKQLVFLRLNVPQCFPHVHEVVKPVLLPRCRIDLEEWEHVTCMKTVALRSQETVSGLKGYIAAGTCLMQGEEVTCRGRVSTTHHYVPPLC